MIAIINYNAGNITSVARALQNIGKKCIITDDTQKLDKATHVIFPGVGAAGEAMAYLREKKLDTWLKKYVKPASRFWAFVWARKLFWIILKKIKPIVSALSQELQSVSPKN